MYRDFADTLAQRLRASLLSVQAGYNFEYGVEWEIVLCETLRQVLPDNYGIARGFLTSRNGDIAGDDIIIYERSRFPTLALRGRDSFARKEFIPVEAAYCYIEAKYTIDLRGRGDASLAKALDQVDRAKRLMMTRDPVEPAQLGPYTKVSVGTGISVGTPPEFPRILNPPYGIILARQVRGGPSGELLTDPEEINRFVEGSSLNAHELPDLAVLGDSNAILPVLTGPTFRSPFYIPERSQLVTRVVPGQRAFAIAFFNILAAIDWIQLGVMPWHRLTVDALGIPYE